MTGRLQGCAAIVTGGAKGIGRSTVELFLAEGAQVAVFDIDAEGSGSVEQLRAAVGRRHECFFYRPTDATDEAQVAEAVAETLDRFGRLDILVNNVGKGLDPMPIEDLSLGDWEAMLRLNLSSAFLCTRAVIRHMKARRRGKIVNVSSQAGRSKSEISNLPYASAKAGLLGFTRNLAFEVGPFGINVNAVAPGVTRTDRVAVRWDRRSEQERAGMIEAIPLRRLGAPDDIAAAILFLASRESDYITGATLDVNGGRTMM
jgi:NAD(P)-dependent dehydrogenase (short-subunit alcohol dehydrogenase family)